MIRLVGPPVNLRFFVPPAGKTFPRGTKAVAHSGHPSIISMKGRRGRLVPPTRDPYNDLIPSSNPSDFTVRRGNRPPRPPGRGGRTERNGNSPLPEGPPEKEAPLPFHFPGQTEDSVPQELSHEKAGRDGSSRKLPPNSADSTFPSNPDIPGRDLRDRAGRPLRRPDRSREEPWAAPARSPASP